MTSISPVVNYFSQLKMEIKLEAFLHQYQEGPQTQPDSGLLRNMEHFPVVRVIASVTESLFLYQPVQELRSGC